MIFTIFPAPTRIRFSDLAGWLARRSFAEIHSSVVMFKMSAICSSVYPQIPPGSDIVPVSPSLPASASRSVNTERTSGDSCRMEPSNQLSQKIFIHVLLPIILLLLGSFVGETVGFHGFPPLFLHLL